MKCPEARPETIMIRYGGTDLEDGRDDGGIEEKGRNNTLQYAIIHHRIQPLQW
jgi:hypothetical protein